MDKTTQPQRHAADTWTESDRGKGLTFMAPITLPPRPLATPPSPLPHVSPPAAPQAPTFSDRLHKIGSATVTTASAVAWLGAITVSGQLGPVGAPVAQLATTTFASRRFFKNKSMRDYIVAFSAMNGATSALWHGIQNGIFSYDGGGADLVKAAIFFAGGAACIAGMNLLDQKSPPKDLTQAALDQDNPGRETFLGKRETSRHFDKAASVLAAKLKSHPELLRFFGYDPNSFDLNAELTHMKVGTNDGALAIGHYFPFTRTLHLAKYCPQALCAHEMMHALHHKALKNAVTRADIAKLPKLLGDDLRPSFIKDRIALIENHLRTGEMDAPLPEDVAWAAADLLMYRGMRKHPEKLESIGSRFDLTTLSLAMPLIWLMRIGEKTTNFLVWPLLKLAGVAKENQMLKMQQGYSNPFVIRKMREEGLVASLLQ